MRTPLIIASVLAVSVAVVSLSFDRYQAERQCVLLREYLKGHAAVLAENAQDTVEPLFEKNPFPHAPPRFMRTRVFEYRFSPWREKGAWWTRTALCWVTTEPLLG